LTRFDEAYKTACLWGAKEKCKDGQQGEEGMGRIVEYFHVFPASCLRRRQGPAVPERDLQKMDGQANAFVTFLSNPGGST